VVLLLLLDGLGEAPRRGPHRAPARPWRAVREEQRGGEGWRKTT
jgi:hypothetical protein